MQNTSNTMQAYVRGSTYDTNGEYADYLNSGDTYNPTVIYWRGSYRVQSIGDFIETMQRQSINFI